MLINVDDELILEAMKLSSQQFSPSKLIHEAITTFIRLQAIKKLAALGGTTPEMKSIPR